jgi:tRNA-specific 2-thiouridylase
MSGGVDSAVVAALLQERGYDVAGLTMRLWHEDADATGTQEALASASVACAQLGIPHHVLDLRAAFRREVVDHFLQEYARGRTPNPCLRCNAAFKFGLLLDQARQLGYDILATGHYARILAAEGRYRLLCAVDGRKDQSYVLYALTQRHLAAVLLPLGDYGKDEVRELARGYGLSVAERVESQDICFLRDNDYRRFLRQQLPEAVRPGPIYDTAGRVRGQHQGLPGYTVGQREGLGIAAPRPLYVLRLAVAENALYVGHAEELGHTALLAAQVSYIAGQPLAAGTAVEAKIRYRARRVAAQVWPQGEGEARVTLAQPLRDISPGQAVVWYAGAEVLGGGIIAEALDP